MAKRILLDNYVVNELSEYRKIRERYDELSGMKQRTHLSDSDLISIAILSEIDSLKKLVEYYEKEEAKNG